jgi:hypothetical protein
VEHTVGANKGLFQSLRADETSFEKQSNRLDDQLVEVLYGDLDLLFLVHQDGVSILGMSPQSGEPVTQATFGGDDTVLETKVLSIVGVSGIS